MKTLKFNHADAQRIRQERKNATWRIYDDEDLHVNDQVQIIDKVDSQHPDTWTEIGTAQIVHVTEKLIRDVVPNDFQDGELPQTPQELLKNYQHSLGQGVSLTTPVKIITFRLSNSGRTIYKDDNKTTTPFEIKIYADGGSRGNPGPSASGYIITTMDDKLVVSNGAYLGVTTNNQAEYQALKFALEEGLVRGARTAHVYMDSMLVVNQMLGIFKVKNRDLWPIHDAAKELAQKYKHITFTHVPRELNKAADKMVNQALDLHQKELRLTEES